MEIQGPSPLDQYQFEADDELQQDIEAGEALIQSEEDAQFVEVDHATSYVLGDDVFVQFQQTDDDANEE